MGLSPLAMPEFWKVLFVEIMKKIMKMKMKMVKVF